MTAPAPVAVAIKVELGADLAALAANPGALAPLEQYAGYLAQDLGVPAQVSVQWTPVPRSAPRALAVWVDDRHCRLEQTPLPARVDLPALVSRISLALYANRELLLSPAVVEELWRNWTGGPGPCPAPVRDALLALAALGLQATHGRLLAQAEAATLAPDVAFEKIVNQTAGRLRIFVSPHGRGRFRFAQGDEDDANTIEYAFRTLTNDLFEELGLICPLGAVVTDPRLADDEFRIQLNDVRMPPRAGLAADEFLVAERVDRLLLLNIEGREAVNPDTGEMCAIIRGTAEADLCRNAGLDYWNHQGFVMLSATAAVRQAAGAFLTTDVVEVYSTKLSEAFPALVTRAQQAFSPAFLTRVLRHLLHEGITIRDLRSLLEGLLTLSERTQMDYFKHILFFLDTDVPVTGTVGFGSGREALAREHAESLRHSLRRLICYRLSRGTNILPLYQLDPAIERRLADPAPLSRDEYGRLIQALAEVGNVPPTARNPVILTAATIRARTRREIEKEFPGLPVVSYQELMPEVSLQPIARIALA
jgi:hypothetical protein